MTTIDQNAISRVLGDDTAEQFGRVSEAALSGDLADAPALLCMAFERWQADPTRSLSEHMDELLQPYAEQVREYEQAYA